MSVVAELLAAAGNDITGSDRTESEALRRIAAQGITIWVGHDPDRVPPLATIVVSTAIRDSDPELAAARKRGQRVIHRSQALAIAAEGRDFIAIAGAHGKTTTSAMLATMLVEANTDPSYAIGGTIRNFHDGGHLGSGRFLIAEADESDRSFLNYSPLVAVVTNIEADHLDNYRDEQDLRETFAAFLGRVRQRGAIICCTDDSGVRETLKLGFQRQPDVQVIGYGFAAPGSEPAAVDEYVQLKLDSSDSSGVSGTLQQPGSAPVTLRVNLPGQHNLADGAAAFLAGDFLGVNPDLLLAGLAEFRGAERRFEKRGEVARIRVFDDYAHHPTEVEELLKQARTVAGNARVLTLFQPHLYSRTRDFAQRFAAVFTQADLAVFTDIYAAREDPIPGVDAALIAEGVPGSVLIPNLEEAAIYLADQAEPGDLLLTVGAGSVTQAGSVIVERLRERFPANA